MTRPSTLLGLGIPQKRRVFFSFHYQNDIWRVNQVRNSWRYQKEDRRFAEGFYDASMWESSQRKGVDSLKALIREGIKNSSVTAVLVDADGKVGIVAGRRRWHALQEAVKQRPDLASIEVRVTEDLETARAWATLENTAREEMDVVDEIRHYGSSLATGLSVPQVAKAYCVTEAHVRRRAALASLSEPVLDALKAGDISMSDAQAFTVSDDQDKQLQVLDALVNGSLWGGAYQIKAALTGEKPSTTCRSARYVGLDTYKKAGGTIDTNLFDDDATINDAEMLDNLFITKLTKAAKAFKKREKWGWVDISDTSNLMAYQLTSDGDFAQMEPIPGNLSDDQQARYDALDDVPYWQLEEPDRQEKAELEEILKGEYSAEQRAIAGAFLYVTGNGTVSAVVGLVKAEDRQEAVGAGFLQSDAAKAAEQAQAAAEKKAQKPAFAAAFVEDMQAIRLAAFQTALLRKPELVLDLLGFGLSRGSHWGNETMAMRFDMERNTPKGDDEAFTLCSALSGVPEQGPDEDGAENDPMAEATVAEAFAAFLAQGKKARNAEITSSFSRAFKTQDDDMMALIADKAGANIREIWAPTAANCFKRMKAAQLDALFQQFLDCQEDSAEFRTFKKLKKGEKDQKMHALFHDADVQAIYKVTPAQKARIDDWTPDCF